MHTNENPQTIGERERRRTHRALGERQKVSLLFLFLNSSDISHRRRRALYIKLRRVEPIRQHQLLQLRDPFYKSVFLAPSALSNPFLLQQSAKKVKNIKKWSDEKKLKREDEVIMNFVTSWPSEAKLKWFLCAQDRPWSDLVLVSCICVCRKISVEKSSHDESRSEKLTREKAFLFSLVSQLTAASTWAPVQEDGVCQSCRKGQALQ